MCSDTHHSDRASAVLSRAEISRETDPSAGIPAGQSPEPTVPACTKPA
jgi:hypothetical protein